MVEINQENLVCLPFCNVHKLETISISPSSNSLRLGACTKPEGASGLGRDMLLYKI